MTEEKAEYGKTKDLWPDGTGKTIGVLLKGVKKEDLEGAKAILIRAKKDESHD